MCLGALHLSKKRSLSPSHLRVEGLVKRCPTGHPALQVVLRVNGLEARAVDGQTRWHLRMKAKTWAIQPHPKQGPERAQAKGTPCGFLGGGCFRWVL